MKAALYVAAIVTIATASPSGYYHQQYNYKTSSSSYRNNELQHKTDDQGYYSKDGDLEGRVKPKVSSNSEHSEYVNPRLREQGSSGYDSGSDLQSQGNLLANSYGSSIGGSVSSGYHSGSQYENDLRSEGLASSDYISGVSGHTGSYGSQSANLRTIGSNVQSDLQHEIQSALVSQSHQAGIAELEAELRRNLTSRLNQVLLDRFGTQTIRGGQSYSLTGGRLQGTPNYDQRELEQLQKQIERSLLDELRQEYNYRTSQSSHQTVNQQNYERYESTTTYRPNTYRPIYPNLNVISPQETYPSYGTQQSQQSQYNRVTSNVQYTQIPNAISITTIASNVQRDLNNQLNRLLEEARSKYFSENSRYTSYSTASILDRLKQELRQNLTYTLEEELRRNFGTQSQRNGYMFSVGSENSNQYNYNVADLENLKRQVEDNLITKLTRDFEAARQNWISTQQHSQSQQSFYGQSQSNDYNYGGSNNLRYEYSTPRYADSDYYRPTAASIVPLISSGVKGGVSGSHQSNYESSSSSSNIAQLQRQLQTDLSGQLQAALTQNKAYLNRYSSTGQGQASFDEAYRRLYEELQRNLTQQLQSYEAGGSSYSNSYGSVSENQLAQLRSQLQRNLASQLQQGLQQTYSASASFSASSGSSASAGSGAYSGSNSGGYYRGTRGSDMAQYGQYRAAGGYLMEGEDCQGDDPSAHQFHRAKRSYGYRSRPLGLSTNTGVGYNSRAYGGYYGSNTGQEEDDSETIPQGQSYSTNQHNQHIGQEIDDTDDTQQIEVDHGFNIGQVGQEEDNLDDTQQIQVQHGFSSIGLGSQHFQSGSLANPSPTQNLLGIGSSFPQRGEDTTQPTGTNRKPVYLGTHSSNIQSVQRGDISSSHGNQFPVGQEEDDSDNTQQTEDNSFSGVAIGSQTNQARQDLTGTDSSPTGSNDDTGRRIQSGQRISNQRSYATVVSSGSQGRYQPTYSGHERNNLLGQEEDNSDDTQQQEIDTEFGTADWNKPQDGQVDYVGIGKPLSHHTILGGSAKFGQDNLVSTPRTPSQSNLNQVLPGNVQPQNSLGQQVDDTDTTGIEYTSNPKQTPYIGPYQFPINLNKLETSTTSSQQPIPTFSQKPIDIGSAFNIQPNVQPTPEPSYVGGSVMQPGNIPVQQVDIPVIPELKDASIQLQNKLYNQIEDIVRNDLPSSNAPNQLYKDTLHNLRTNITSECQKLLDYSKNSYLNIQQKDVTILEKYIESQLVQKLEEKFRTSGYFRGESIGFQSEPQHSRNFYNNRRGYGHYPRYGPKPQTSSNTFLQREIDSQDNQYHLSHNPSEFNPVQFDENPKPSSANPLESDSFVTHNVFPQITPQQASVLSSTTPLATMVNPDQQKLANAEYEADWLIQNLRNSLTNQPRQNPSNGIQQSVESNVANKLSQNTLNQVKLGNITPEQLRIIEEIEEDFSSIINLAVQQEYSSSNLDHRSNYELYQISRNKLEKEIKEKLSDTIKGTNLKNINLNKYSSLIDEKFEYGKIPDLQKYLEIRLIKNIRAQLKIMYNIETTDETDEIPSEPKPTPVNPHHNVFPQTTPQQVLSSTTPLPTMQTISSPVDTERKRLIDAAYESNWLYQNQKNTLTNEPRQNPSNVDQGSVDSNGENPAVPQNTIIRVKLENVTPEQLRVIEEIEEDFTNIINLAVQQDYRPSNLDHRSKYELYRIARNKLEQEIKKKLSDTIKGTNLENIYLKKYASLINQKFEHEKIPDLQKYLEIRLIKKIRAQLKIKYNIETTDKSYELPSGSIPQSSTTQKSIRTEKVVVRLENVTPEQLKIVEEIEEDFSNIINVAVQDYRPSNLDHRSKYELYRIARNKLEQEIKEKLSDTIKGTNLKNINLNKYSSLIDEKFEHGKIPDLQKYLEIRLIKKIRAQLKIMYNIETTDESYEIASSTIPQSSTTQESIRTEEVVVRLENVTPEQLKIIEELEEDFSNIIYLAVQQEPTPSNLDHRSKYELYRIARNKLEQEIKEKLSDTIKGINLQDINLKKYSRLINQKFEHAKIPDLEKYIEIKLIKKLRTQLKVLYDVETTEDSYEIIESSSDVPAYTTPKTERVVVRLENITPQQLKIIEDIEKEISSIFAIAVLHEYESRKSDHRPKYELYQISLNKLEQEIKSKLSNTIEGTLNQNEENINLKKYSRLINRKFEHAKIPDLQKYLEIKLIKKVSAHLKKLYHIETTDGTYEIPSDTNMQEYTTRSEPRVVRLENITPAQLKIIRKIEDDINKQIEAAIQIRISSLRESHSSNYHYQQSLDALELELKNNITETIQRLCEPGLSQHSELMSSNFDRTKINDLEKYLQIRLIKKLRSNITYYSNVDATTNSRVTYDSTSSLHYTHGSVKGGKHTPVSQSQNGDAEYLTNISSEPTNNFDTTEPTTPAGNWWNRFSNKVKQGAHSLKDKITGKS